MTVKKYLCNCKVCFTDSEPYLSPRVKTNIYVCSNKNCNYTTPAKKTYVLAVKEWNKPLQPINLSSRKYNRDSGRWSETAIQEYIVTRLRSDAKSGKHKLLIASDANSRKSNQYIKAKEKRTGLLTGHPDLRIYLPNGKLLLVELKIGNNSFSNGQLSVCKELAKLDYPIAVIRANTPIHGYSCVLHFIKSDYKSGITNIEWNYKTNNLDCCRLFV